MEKTTPMENRLDLNVEWYKIDRGRHSDRDPWRHWIRGRILDAAPDQYPEVRVEPKHSNRRTYHSITFIPLEIAEDAQPAVSINGESVGSARVGYTSVLGGSHWTAAPQGGRFYPGVVLSAIVEMTDEWAAELFVSVGADLNIRHKAEVAANELTLQMDPLTWSDPFNSGYMQAVGTFPPEIHRNGRSAIVLVPSRKELRFWGNDAVNGAAITIGSVTARPTRRIRGRGRFTAKLTPEQLEVIKQESEAVAKASRKERGQALIVEPFPDVVLKVGGRFDLDITGHFTDDARIDRIVPGPGVRAWYTSRRSFRVQADSPGETKVTIKVANADAVRASQVVRIVVEAEV